MKKAIDPGATEILQRLEGKVNELGQAQDTWFTLEELAAYLKISKSAAYKGSMRRAYPGAFRPAGTKRLYFSKREIDEWIRSMPLTTAAQAEQAAVDYVTTGKPRRAR
jgi:predicted DNA-binding transcriptional regulator AlpA